MRSRTASPSPWRVSLRHALVVVLLFGVLLTVIEVAEFAQTGPGWWLTSLVAVVGLVYTVAGVTCWWARPDNRMGLITVLGGAVLFGCALLNTMVPVLAAVGCVLAITPLAVMTWVLLAFPSGRLTSVPTRVVVGAIIFASLVVQAPAYLFNPRYHPSIDLSVADRPDVVVAAGQWTRAVAIASLVATGVILALRLRRASASQRRVLALMYGWGIAAVFAAILAPNVLQNLLGITADTRFLIQIGAIAILPISLSIAIITGRLTTTTELQQLGAWLAAPASTRPPVTSALSRALGDPSVTLNYWSEAQDGLVDERGQPATPPQERGQVAVVAGDRTVGIISYDRQLNPEAEVVRQAGRVVAIAIDRDRLLADLRASERALQMSRRRIVDAADRERRRIAHDLHDGMQVQLVSIAVRVQHLADSPEASPTIRDSATEVRTSIDVAARELRELVHHVMPAALIERDLCAAIEDLADRMPIPTQLDAHAVSDDLPDDLQRTAYFIVAEALTNAVRHAHATELQIRLHRTDSRLSIEVVDDGVGGARVSHGLGLRGVADRVDVHGGLLTLSSPPGQGTCLRAELPCVS